MIGKENVISNMRKQIGKDGETSFQIRIFDDKTGGVAYKYLTGDELSIICKLLNKSLVFI